MSNVRNLTPDRDNTFGAAAAALVLFIALSVKEFGGVQVSEAWIAAATVIVQFLVTHFTPRSKWSDEDRAKQKDQANGTG